MNDGRKNLVLVDRDAWGRYKPGCSGNPFGRPAIASEIRQAAAAHSLDAIELLATVMRDADQTMPARFLAAREILKVSGYHLPDERSDDLRALSDDQLRRLIEAEDAERQSADGSNPPP